MVVADLRALTLRCRATIASPAESIYDDDDEEPGLEGRGAATKRKFDDAIIQQRMEEDRERVSLLPLLKSLGRL